MADDVGAVEDDLALPVLVGRAVRAEDDAHARRPRRVAPEILALVLVLVRVNSGVRWQNFALWLRDRLRRYLRRRRDLCG